MMLFAETALLADGWASNVLFDVDQAGFIRELHRDAEAVPADAERARGPVLPGVPNLHSHAFQRALAGLTETRGPGDDSFWTWRRQMYDFVARVTPDRLERIAAQLYAEMLKAGYTTVGEFHYLHHDPDGKPYATPSEMADRVMAAAETAGIAITLLPVLYSSGGFGGAPPGEGQRRFVHDVEHFVRLLESLFAAYRAREGARVGIAPHSLRAVTREQLDTALGALTALDERAPVHIHVAEQTREVDECLAWSGRRPVQWLLDNFEVDGRWCLVHATHVDGDEIARLAASEAVAGLCPSTEANLGDGIFPAEDFLAREGRFGIGSDSHVSVSPVEELRLLEYGQRLLHRRRAMLASRATPSVGRTLLEGAVAGGARALAQPCGGLDVGTRADLVVLDPQAPNLVHRRGDALLDAWLFAGNVNAVSDVMVAGRWRVREGRHEDEETVFAAFRDAVAG